MTKDPQESNTCIIFDWDDTLLPSYWLSKKGYLRKGYPPEIISKSQDDIDLRKLMETACRCLDIAIKKSGNVYIVTNSDEGWVQLSTQRFIPDLMSFLKKIKIISAKTKFENKFPGQPLLWKLYAMQEILFQFKNIKSIISMGDSQLEREAVNAIGKVMPQTYTKSIKFADKPTCELLTQQLELVISCNEVIISHCANLDLQLTITTPTLTLPTSTPIPS